MASKHAIKYYIPDTDFFVTTTASACGYELHYDCGLDKEGNTHAKFLGHWGTLTGFLAGLERYLVRNQEFKGKTGRKTLQDLLDEQVRAIEYVKSIRKEMEAKLNGR